MVGSVKGMEPRDELHSQIAMHAARASNLGGWLKREFEMIFCFYVICARCACIGECKYITINYTILKRDISRLSVNNMYI